MKELKVGLLGFGTIGTGVVKLLQQNAEVIRNRLGAPVRLLKIADLDIETDRGVKLEEGLLTADAEEVLSNPEIDVVIELIGGYEPARSFVLKAIANGKHVVTANKALLAVHGEEIFAAAADKGVEVMFEASVGGGIPIITSLKENLGANRFQSIFGILNGTCNYILTRMTNEGEEFAAVLKDAQQAGYAEADPTFDIEGIDTAHKLALLVSLCFGTRVDFKQIYAEGISSISSLDIQFARQFGYKIKLLAIGKMHDNGSIEARVHPTMIPEHYPLADVDGAFNAVRVTGDFVGPVMQYGLGAGMNATASAVVGDVMSLARSGRGDGEPRSYGYGCRPDALQDLPLRSMDDICSQYYLRFTTVDQPGVLAAISGKLGEYRISIASMIQPERRDDGAVPIVIMTHEAAEKDMRAALAEIDQLQIVQSPSHLIRIEGSLD
ncbi:homoserine dehydrogenase [Geothermobacter hydrogeniphilus]|uniref:Homoserine dehydrogenase n=1 Tax=Geothermobacter hydrogeniphilus TaxID=1969733 RepID=A0A2K2H8A5_9BACT|nr:homoserine dehydrogenase [Geothermobacter hydrogeniphilus]PNU19544.1 homoserine dehydrogenase [Geothermobacter hydrogeniphilus]